MASSSLVVVASGWKVVHSKQGAKRLHHAVSALNQTFHIILVVLRRRV